MSASITLTVTTVGSTVFTVSIPGDANASDVVRGMATQGGVWDEATNTFYPMTQIASVAAS